MKKENIVAISMALAGGILFMLGMVMTLVEEWNTLVAGIVLGAIGLITLLLIIPIYRKLGNYPPLKKDKNVIIAYVVGTLGAIILGIGMCFALNVFNFSYTLAYLIGIPVGIVGIVVVILTPIIYLAKSKQKNENQKNS